MVGMLCIRFLETIHPGINLGNQKREADNAKKTKKDEHSLVSNETIVVDENHNLSV